MARPRVKVRLTLDVCEGRLSPDSFLSDFADPLGLGHLGGAPER